MSKYPLFPDFYTPCFPDHTRLLEGLCVIWGALAGIIIVSVLVGTYGH